MNRKNDLTISSLSIFASQGFTTVISIIFIAYFARVFSKEQMAIYATLTMISGWTLMLSEMGMVTLIEKDVSQLTASGKYFHVKKLVSSMLLYRTVIVLLISIVFWVSSPILAKKLFGNSENLNLIKYVVLISFFLSFSSALGNIQVATQRFVQRSVIGSIEILAQRALCVVGYLYGGVFGFFTGFFMATLLGLILCFLDVRSFLTWKVISVGEMLRLSSGYYFLSLLRAAGDEVDRPIIALFLGAEALAGYHIAKRLYDNLFGLTMAISVPTGVKYGEVKVEGYEVLKDFYHRSLVMVAHLFIPLGFFFIITAKSLLLLYGGEKYISSGPVLEAFGFTLMGVVIWVMVRQAALRLISVRHLAYQYVVTSVVTITFYCALLPLLGATGIPIAMGLGYISGLIPVAYQLKKQWRLTWPTRQFLSSCGCGLCLMVIIVPASIFSPGLGKLIFVSVLSTFLYLAWLHFVGPKEVRELLNNFVKNKILKQTVSIK